MAAIGEAAELNAAAERAVAHGDTMSRATSSLEADRRAAEANAVRAQADRQRIALDRGRFITGRIGTQQGRMIDVEVQPGAGVVTIRDAAVTHHGGVLAQMNFAQCAELVEALVGALPE